MTPKTMILVYFEMWIVIQGQQTPLPLTTWQKKKQKKPMPTIWISNTALKKTPIGWIWFTPIMQQTTRKKIKLGRENKEKLNA
jgi:hypothetical protein